MDSDKDIAECKRDLRKQIREAASNLTESDRIEQSQNVLKRVEATDVFTKANNIGAFLSLPDEIYTHDSVRRWAERKNVFLPKIEGGRMVFVEYLPGNGLSRDELNIECPQAGRRIDPLEIDLMIVPGVAFDKHGNRMGRGKGFYDRYLEYTDAYKIGVCLSHQLVENIPCAPHDIKMDLVIYPDE